MKYIILLLLLPVSALAQNNTGTLVIAPIRPQATNDTFPSAIANEIRGGPFTVTNLAGLSNIPAERLTIGSLGYAESTGLYYRLTSTSPVTWAGIDGANFTNVGTTVDFPIAITNGGSGATNAGGARTNLGLGLPTLTNTNNDNFLSSIGLSSTNSVSFARVTVEPTASASAFIFGTNNTGLWSGPDADYRSFSVRAGGSTLLFFETNRVLFATNIAFDGGSSGIIAATTRTNIGLGLPVLTNTNNTNFLNDLGIGTNSSPTFSTVSVSNLLVTGNFTNTGTIYGLKTDSGPFEGIGNFFASNNTTVSNETLFRVGLAEETNKSAQFGFRVARTNNGGEGFAVFSVYGYNALMMIGPSDRSRSNSLTNTNAGIEADIWSIGPTNKVMTLITTNTGAMEMHRPIGFNTNNVSTTPPSNTNVTNPTGWIEMYVGTNSVRVPYYQ
jgi:hypothetical protein